MNLGHPNHLRPPKVGGGWGGGVNPIFIFEESLESSEIVLPHELQMSVSLSL